MASSTSKSTGRCKHGSRVRWPGSTSRSSHVTSARHDRAEGRQPRRQLGSLQREAARRGHDAAALPAAGQRGVLGDPGRASRDVDAECGGAARRVGRPGTGSTPPAGPTRWPRTPQLAGHGRPLLRVETAPEASTPGADRAGRTAVPTGRACGSRRLPRCATVEVPGPCAAIGSEACGRRRSSARVRSRRTGRHDHVPENDRERVAAGGGAGTRPARRTGATGTRGPGRRAGHGQGLPRQARGRAPT